MNLTKKQKEIILNLILAEQEKTNFLNANIAPLLKEYKNELTALYREINNSIE